MPNMPKIAQAQVSDIPIGFNARLFPNNWRPALNEIDFGAQHEFAALQFPGREEGTNEAFLGATFAEVRQKIQGELKQLHSDMTALMTAALDAGSEALSEGREDYVLSGERNLLQVQDLSSNMTSVRKLFDVFEQKTVLMQLLDKSQLAQGVQIFIGGESGLAPLDECSVVTAPYEVDGKIVGTVGVIGPTRMAYERIIPIVDITAKLLSSAMSHH